MVNGYIRESPFIGLVPENWDVVENTHEPIISFELWNQVQEINHKHARQAKESSGKYSQFPPAKSLYGKRLVCADCGRPMKNDPFHRQKWKVCILLLSLCNG